MSKNDSADAAFQIETRKLNACVSAVIRVARSTETTLPRCDELSKELAAKIGPGWNFVTAVQYLSGKKAKAIIDEQAQSEKPVLLFAHLVAKDACSQNGLGNAPAPDNIDKAEFESACRQVREFQIGELRTTH